MRSFRTLLAEAALRIQAWGVGSNTFGNSVPDLETVRASI